MPTPKQQVIASLEQLPDTATFDDLLYRVYVIHSINAGMADARAGHVVSHEDVKREIFGRLHDEQDHLTWRTAEKLHHLAPGDLARVDAFIEALPRNTARDDMPTNIDFSKAERGKFYREGAKMHLPVYLDDDVQATLTTLANAKGIDLSVFVNDLLKKDIELMQMAR